jgi:import receptor subunit TOM22
MDPESEISNEDEEVLDEESLYERISALKDMLPPSARRTITSSVSSLTSFTKASISFSGRALWVISTSAFLIGVPWALAYAEEEQYIQMEREQGMIKGANEVCFRSFLGFNWPFHFKLSFLPRLSSRRARIFLNHRPGVLDLGWLENLSCFDYNVASTT